MRKIPPGSEADNILVGEIDFLERAISAFVRLNQACHLGDLTEVPVPTRFLFILLGPHRLVKFTNTLKPLYLKHVDKGFLKIYLLK
jgi:hypothetical protein